VPAWGIEAAQDIHQRALSGTRGSHQRYVFVLKIFERHPFEDREGLFAHIIAFTDIFQLDNRNGVWPCAVVLCGGVRGHAFRITFGTLK
jgi:hypothetical protein